MECCFLFVSLLFGITIIFTQKFAQIKSAHVIVFIGLFAERIDLFDKAFLRIKHTLHSNFCIFSSFSTKFSLQQKFYLIHVVAVLYTMSDFFPSISFSCLTAILHHCAPKRNGPLKARRSSRTASFCNWYAAGRHSERGGLGAGSRG